MDNSFLCKAKELSSRKWVQGSLAQFPGNDGECVAFILPDDINPKCCDGNVSMETASYPRVDPCTVCHCTGIPGKDGKLLWENDIVTNGKYVGVVRWGIYNLSNYGFFISWTHDDWLRNDIMYWAPSLCTVGNIFENNAGDFSG